MREGDELQELGVGNVSIQDAKFFKFAPVRLGRSFELQ